jgi:hypothetical protein
MDSLLALFVVDERASYELRLCAALSVVLALLGGLLAVAWRANRDVLSDVYASPDRFKLRPDAEYISHVITGVDYSVAAAQAVADAAADRVPEADGGVEGPVTDQLNYATSIYASASGARRRAEARGDDARVEGRAAGSGAAGRRKGDEDGDGDEDDDEEEEEDEEGADGDVEDESAERRGRIAPAPAQEPAASDGGAAPVQLFATPVSGGKRRGLGGGGGEGSGEAASSNPALGGLQPLNFQAEVGGGGAAKEKSPRAGGGGGGGWDER